MNVTPLFQSGDSLGTPTDEEMIRYLDEPEDSADKRAFLNRLSMSESDWQRWENLLHTVDTGKRLHQSDPDPAIRARVLDVAFAEAETIAAKRSQAPFGRWLHNWKWALAASILVFSWGAFNQMESQDTILSRGEQMDEELLSLEEDIDLLMEDLGLGFDLYDEQV